MRYTPVKSTLMRYPFMRIPVKYMLMKYTPVRYMPMRCTPIRYRPMRHMPVRCTPIRCTLIIYRLVRHIPVRCTPMRHVYEVYPYEMYCEGDKGMPKGRLYDREGMATMGRQNLETRWVEKPLIDAQKTVLVLIRGLVTN